MNFWYYLAVLIISVIVQIAMAPKPVKPMAAVLTDFEFPQVDEGTPQSVVFGDVWVAGWMVLAYGNLRTEEIQGEGGK